MLVAVFSFGTEQRTTAGDWASSLLSPCPEPAEKIRSTEQTDNSFVTLGLVGLPAVAIDGFFFHSTIQLQPTSSWARTALVLVLLTAGSFLGRDL